MVYVLYVYASSGSQIAVVSVPCRLLHLSIFFYFLEIFNSSRHSDKICLENVPFFLFYFCIIFYLYNLIIKKTTYTGVELILNFVINIHNQKCAFIYHKLNEL